ncbi:MAG: glycosyl hydrolase family 28 protein [Armatimonadota bacterium]
MSAITLSRMIALAAGVLLVTGLRGEAMGTETAGWRHSVVLNEDGGLRAWGEGALGQLGNGDFANSDEPVEVLGPDGAGRLTGIVAVSAGMYHTLAIDADGAVWAWGANTFGQLGDGRWGMDAHSAVPVRVSGIDGEGHLDGAVAVAGGWDHSVALLDDGTLVAWGSRCHGQLGDGLRDSNDWSVHPVQVRGVEGADVLTGVREVVCGAHHTAALLENGTLVAWGSNHEGQLGRGHLGEIGRMHRVELRLPWTPEETGRWTIALGYTYTDQSHLDVAGQVELLDEFDGPPLVVVDEVVEAETVTGEFARRADEVEMAGTIRYPARAQVGQSVMLELPEILIGSHDGDNDYARDMHLLLRNLDTDESVVIPAQDALMRATALPTPVTGSDGEGVLEGVTAVAAGVYHTVAVRDDGSVWSWGYNGTGQLGHGTRESSAGSQDLYVATPTQLIGGAQGGDFLTGITAVAAGYETTYVLDEEGRGWACGWNVYGGLGRGVGPNDSYNAGRMQRVSLIVDDELAQVEGLTGIVAGAYHALAVDADGALLGWGHNGFGQLGDSTRLDRFTPLPAGVPAPDAAGFASREPVIGPAPASPAVTPHFSEPDRADPDVIDARERGAVGDGVHLDQEALQAAIDAAHEAGGGTVIVPAGVYRTGVLVLKSGVRLHLAEGATLLGSTNRSHYEPRAMIYADGAEEIAITGSGTIDGHGRFAPNRGWRHRVISMYNCTDVTVEGIATTNSGSWTQHYTRVIDLTLRNIRLNCVRPGRNNDGLDFTGCEDVLIEGCVIASDDDCIVIKSNAAAHVNRNIRAVNNIVYAYASGFKLGTETRSIFENIECDGLQAFGGTTLGLYTVDGSNTSNVRVANVRAEASRCALGVRLGARLREGYFAEGEERVPGSLENVLVRDIDIELAAVPWREVLLAHGIENAEVAHQLRVRPVETSFVSGLEDHPVRNVLLEDIRIAHPGGGSEELALIDVPERPEAYPAARMFGTLPAWGLYLRHAENVTLRDIRLELGSFDGRPPLVNENLADEDLTIEGLSVHEAWR